VSADQARAQPDAKPGSYALVTATDTGGGIPALILEKIFEPFFTTKGLGKGTGLGLSTVVGIVKSHGGFMNVHSEEGCGTTFEVYLPASPEAVAPPVAEPRREPSRGEKGTVLVVDDEGSIRELTKQILQTYGFRVLTAENGAEALTLYKAHRQEIRLFITDMAMPFMSGEATIRAIQRIDPAIRIIAMSGYFEGSNYPQLTNSENLVFLNKPFTAAKLFEHVRGILGDD